MSMISSQKYSTADWVDTIESNYWCFLNVWEMIIDVQKETPRTNTFKKTCSWWSYCHYCQETIV